MELEDAYTGFDVLIPQFGTERVFSAEGPIVVVPGNFTAEQAYPGAYVNYSAIFAAPYTSPSSSSFKSVSPGCLPVHASITGSYVQLDRAELGRDVTFEDCAKLCVDMDTCPENKDAEEVCVGFHYSFGDRRCYMYDDVPSGSGTAGGPNPGNDFFPGSRVYYHRVEFPEIEPEPSQEEVLQGACELLQCDTSRGEICRARVDKEEGVIARCLCPPGAARSEGSSRCDVRVNG